MIKLQYMSDKAAIGVSLLCVIHCLVLPIAMILIPPLAGLSLLKSESFHLWLVGAVVPVSLLALFFGYQHHRKIQVFVGAFIGLLILLVAAYLGHEILGDLTEVCLTVFGSCVIAFSHYWNYQLRRDHLSSA
ncbi:MerC domain-containing protein [Thalassotalea sediminis]|uniref:MerC domain-containing protein n=1 Tax=Thalassotalea sediminis TaxID=1759089 RepID=UPI00257340F6|nr:MerC domain-containing protein [Thalassotalea sediminis]